MLIANSKPICLIGYADGTLVQEARHFFGQEFLGEIIVMEPEEFLSLTDYSQYQYGVAFTLDQELRQKVINLIDSKNLDCIIYIHDTAICYTKNITNAVGAGSFIGPFSTLLLDSHVGRHCIVESYCLISHYANLGNNVQLHSGAMIAGRTSVGDNAVFNFRAAAVNALTLCSNIEIGAASTVTKNIDQSGRYVGTPARRIGDLKVFENVQ